MQTAYYISVYLEREIHVHIKEGTILKKMYMLYQEKGIKINITWLTKKWQS